jgi:hypothetical protein
MTCHRATIGRDPGEDPMTRVKEAAVKFVIPVLLAVLSMGIALIVMSVFLKLDLKAELGRFLPIEDLPEPPTPDLTVDAAI